ncbi:MAG: tetratricopeptide repeat protein [Candidatus Obscuribacterales bacterium]|nr:tetratricopeptide repeat protein [Candidatus Obscuribacterales bacterium]
MSTKDLLELQSKRNSHILKEDASVHHNCDFCESSEHDVAHEDILEFCILRDELEPSHSNHKEHNASTINGAIDAIAKDCHTMLTNAETPIRIDAAHRVISSNPELGLPYAILARDEEKDFEKRQRLYATALEKLLIERESQKENWEKDISELELQAPYFIYAPGIEIIASEAAKELWHQKHFDDAISLLKRVIDSLGVSECELVYLATSYLIMRDSDAAAKELLAKMPVSTSEWFYLNALLLFRETGDSALARACLRVAASEDPVYLFEIVGAKKVETDPAYELFNSCCWHQTEGCQAWLTSFFKTIKAKAAVAAEDLSEQDSSKIKRWKTLFEIADAQIERGSWKEARRDAKAALKTISNVSGQADAVSRSIEQLELINNESELPLDDIMSAASQYAEAELKILGNEYGAARLKITLARLLLDQKKFVESEKFLREGIQLLETLLKENDLKTDFSDLADAYSNLGESLAEQRKYDEAASAFRQSVALQEQYLDRCHPDLLSDLDYLAKCLHYTGKHADEAQVQVQLSKIVDDEELLARHEGHGKECVWSVPACPLQ